MGLPDVRPEAAADHCDPQPPSEPFEKIHEHSLLRIVTLAAAGGAIAHGSVALQYQATVNPMLAAVAVIAMLDRSIFGRR
jgi:hypothetical protein